ncbi:MAG: hydrolase 1, exosortase A system-associated [Rhodoferax sp.]|nr:hydrolase 1, exosortase A system-associated [Rhodoferax sp.]
MMYREDALILNCEGEHMLAILSQPVASTALDVGVVIVVGGPQYRVGSHRQFKLLADRLAGAGIATLRFDYRGMGDSTGDLRSFEDVSADIGTAIDALIDRSGHVKKVVIWGLCDGASAALLYQHAANDARVRGLCLLNPWVRSEVSLARAQVKHYYANRLRERAFWLKLLSGQVAGTALRSLWRNLRTARARPQVSAETAHYQQRMAAAWRRFDGNILLVLSEHDYTAKEFLEYTQMNRDWHELLNRATVLRHELADADHTCSDMTSRSAVESLTLEWTQRHVT